MGASLRPPFLAGALALGLLLAPAAWAQQEAPSAARAWEACRAGDSEAALLHSEAGVREAPGLAAAWVIRGYVLSTAGRKPEAAVAYRKAVDLDAADAVAKNNLGAVLLELGRVDEAEGLFRAALEIDPVYADARNNLGVALERLGRLSDAGEAYREATRVDPVHAHALNNQGALALREGRRAEAEAALRKADEIAPGLGAPALNLALLRGADPIAGEGFERLLAAAARPGAPAGVVARALAARGEREAAEGRWPEARALYLEALERGGDDPSVYNNLAVAEDQLGLDRDAMLHLDAALRARPDDLVARNNVGVVHVHRGTYDLAADVFVEILERDPRFHRAHYNLGVVRAAQGRLAESLRSFERAAALAPRDGEVRYNLGVLRRQTGGTPARERADYEAALALDPGLPEAHLALGCLLADPQTPRRLRDEARARAHLTRFLEIGLTADTEGREQAEAWLAWLSRRR